MSEVWKNGSTTKWRKIRKAVLERDGYRCQLKLDVCTHRATCVHHLYGRAEAGDDPKYLVASCQPCNVKVGDPTKADPKIQPRTAW